MKKRFNKINIEISNICNLHCSFCPEVHRQKQWMDPQLLESIVQQAAPLTDQVCFHLMGDPLVHPKLEECLAICARENVPVFFVTNGTLLREKQSHLLLNPIIRQVNFSLHSFHDNFPDQDPSIYLERIFVFTETAFKLRPDLYINFRLWNLQDVKNTGKQNLEILSRIETRFQFKMPSDIDVRFKKGIQIKDRLYLHFDTEFIWPNLDLPILGTSGRCQGLSNHFGILVDGTVVPCCLDKEGAIPLGNVSNQPLEEILNSTKARAILEGFKKRILVEPLCQRCQYIERFT